MVIKKILIIKPKATEYKDENGNIVRTHYDYPKYYDAQHARHICYNFSGAKKLKGKHLAEGMVIYEAEENEIKLLLRQNGAKEIDYNKALIKGKKWKPKTMISTPVGKVEKKEFDIKNWISSHEISDKKLK